MNNTESFVLYESVYKQFEILKKRKPDAATDFIEAIMEYSILELNRTITEEKKDISDLDETVQNHETRIQLLEHK